MTLSVTVDASVFAAPLRGEADREEVLEYIERLKDWRNLLGEEWVPVHMSERAVEALFDEERFPSPQLLAEAFHANGIEEAPDLVSRIATSLLERTPTFEEKFKLTDVLWSDLATEPELPPENELPAIGGELRRCLILAAMLKQCRESTRPAHTLVLRTRFRVSEIRVATFIDYLEHRRDDVPTCPGHFRGTVPVCHSFRDLIRNVEETELWRSATDEADAEKAVQVALYKHRLERGLDPDWNSVPAFTFGESFLEHAALIVGNGPDGILAKLLRAMVDTLEGLNLNRMHALRISAGGGAPQQMRNEDRACRRDVDYDYHLHYWQGPGGFIEFASVGPHDDFSIPK